MTLTAFLASPQTAPIMPSFPLASPEFKLGEGIDSSSTIPAPIRRETWLRANPKKEPWIRKKDPLYELKIEMELRKEMRENIAHLRDIGAYRGKRHMFGYPVRGQNTQTNAFTARKLNRIERRN
jgi:small subunit ribosomal protein S13